MIGSTLNSYSASNNNSLVFFQPSDVKVAIIGTFLCGDLQVITDIVLVVWDKAEENNEDWSHCKWTDECNSNCKKFCS